ncbi:MAG: NUDIX domain-containing protein [Thaumarchaeota archaeon]|nr:NUDIX domain-containing protein [Candidatus Calditenuaceae archaeon]MDW8187348.1 NUDIX domain-containing protein [Nitrososphaerota archaeon]
MPERKSAGAVIFNDTIGDRYYLLLLYSAGHWDFPKGGIEEGETEVDAVVREVYEETGIKELQLINGFRQMISYSYKSQQGEVKKSVVFYLAKTETFDVKLSHEHKGYAWLKFEDAVDQLTYNTAKSVLRGANGFLNELKRAGYEGHLKQMR